MVGKLEKRFLLPGDPGWHTHIDVDDFADQKYSQPPRRFLNVKCAGCGLDLTYPAGTDIKQLACPSCGISLVQSRSTKPTSSFVNFAPATSSPPLETAPAAEEVPYAIPVSEDMAPPVVKVGCIGRGNAGKTALFRALNDELLGDFLPSGLHVDADEPREVARMIREAEQTERLLHQAGLPPTLVASQIQYSVYEGAATRANFQLREVIGQILTHTLPSSEAGQQSHFNEYIANLAQAGVLWAVIPCPASNPGPRERRRYANDLRITMAYLREAIRLRAPGEQVAVCLVLSKMDTLFASEQEARSALTDEMLQRWFGPLVDLLQTSEVVSEAAIVPVSAFGFGNAMVKEGSGVRDGMRPHELDEPFGTEPIWILREGVDAVPFNLEALFLWTLLFGLRKHEESGTDQRKLQIRRVNDLLQSDLESSNPWILPLR